MIVDEAHEYKDPSVQKTQTLVQILQSPKTSKLLLTATPILNNVTELFIPLTLVGNLTLNYS